MKSMPISSGTQPDTVAPIHVTRPHLPSLSSFVSCLRTIWSRRILTNNGPFHAELEAALASYWSVPYVSLFCNGTLAMMTALKALGIKGDVITTPFSFPATSHCLTLSGLTPVFCDISLDNFTLDPQHISSCITSRTEAIVPVHVYGYPCNCDQIEHLASRHSLRVLYDAAHAFGVCCRGRSLIGRGDASMVSFHATKIFNTVEGGAVACHSIRFKQRMEHFKNHGIKDETRVVMAGFNAKMNELQAALGILQLREVDMQLRHLRLVHERYRELLYDCCGVKFPVDPSAGVKCNYAYCPILIDHVECGRTRNYVYERLKRYGIYTRRYFYPLISDLPHYREVPSASREHLPNAYKISNQILCLPAHSDLPLTKVDYICRSLRTVLVTPPNARR
jgi:dTDP-4-amino-4,6-dideoxygalactose transaminase